MERHRAKRPRSEPLRRRLRAKFLLIGFRFRRRALCCVRVITIYAICVSRGGGARASSFRGKGHAGSGTAQARPPAHRRSHRQVDTPLRLGKHVWTCLRGCADGRWGWGGEDRATALLLHFQGWAIDDVLSGLARFCACFGLWFRSSGSGKNNQLILPRLIPDRCGSADCCVSAADSSCKDVRLAPSVVMEYMGTCSVSTGSQQRKA